MTIISARYISDTLSPAQFGGRDSPRPPARLWYAADPPFKGYQPDPSDGYRESSESSAIVIDNG